MNRLSFFLQLDKSLILHSTKGMNKIDWLSYRGRGVGASDVGTVLGLNQYKSSIELWYEKVGQQVNFSLENIAMFMGHYHEDAVADLWQFWDGTQDGMIRNYRDGKIVRKCQRVTAYVNNPKYPWLFVSLDRKINKGDKGKEGALEIKTIAGYEADKWESGIPPSHIVQVQTQMMVCMFDFGEIAAMRDGRQFDVYPFEARLEMHQIITERTLEFWEKVKRGRVLMMQKYEAVKSYNMKKANDLQAEIETMEPPPDGTEAYESFLKAKYKKPMAEIGLVPGTESLYIQAQKHQKLKVTAKEIEAEIREYENVFKRTIGNGRKIDFGTRGHITWDGDPRRFYNKIK